MVTARLLEDAGATVRIVDVPASEKCNGIDDFLTDNEDDALWALLTNALDLTTAERQAHRYDRDDIGRAERLGDEMLAADITHLYRFDLSSTRGGAFRWVGTHWDEDPKPSILWHLARELADRDPEDNAGRSLASLKRAAELAASRDGLSFATEDLDADAFLLNAANGTIDLHDGSIKAHDPADAITRVTPVSYDPDMETPIWNKFLLEIACGDPELVLYLQRSAGQGAIGKITDPKLNILLGPGRNGKSLLLKLLSLALGGGFVTTIPAEALLGEAKPDQLAGLRGMRIVLVNEISQGTHMSDGNLKTMTSGDEISARQLFHKGITFVPTWSLFVALNHAPLISAQDLGTWDRLRWRVALDGSASLDSR